MSKLSSSVFENFKCFRCLHLGLWGLHQTRHNFEGLYMPKLNVILYTGVNKELEVSCLDLFCAIILIVNRTQTRTSQVLGICIVYSNISISVCLTRGINILACMHSFVSMYVLVIMRLHDYMCLISEGLL